VGGVLPTVTVVVIAIIIMLKVMRMPKLHRERDMLSHHICMNTSSMRARALL
jgi:hypothetical protein